LLGRRVIGVEVATAPGFTSRSTAARRWSGARWAYRSTIPRERYWMLLREASIVFNRQCDHCALRLRFRGSIAGSRINLLLERATSLTRRTRVAIAPGSAASSTMEEARTQTAQMRH